MWIYVWIYLQLSNLRCDKNPVRCCGKQTFFTAFLLCFKWPDMAGASRAVGGPHGGPTMRLRGS